MNDTSSDSSAAIEIRPARDADYDAVLEVWRDAGLKASLGGRDRREEFLRQRKRFADLFLVAVANGDVVGVVCGTHDERKGWINRLAVCRRFQRCGVVPEPIPKSVVRVCNPCNPPVETGATRDPPVSPLGKGGRWSSPPLGEGGRFVAPVCRRAGRWE